MRDKRPVDELSIAELERILAIRKREERLQRLRRYESQGRRMPVNTVADAPPPATPPPAAPAVRQTAPAAVAAPPDTPAQLVADDLDDLEPAFVEPESAPGQGGASEFWRMVWNRTLLLVEVLAFAGLVLIGVQMVQGLQTIDRTLGELNAESQQLYAQASLPTPTATPEITLANVVLPGGHTPPTSPGGSVFAINEIPEHLRPLIQRQLAAPIELPTPSPQSAIHIQIPSINVDHPIVAGTDWESLKQGVGQQPGTGLPGQSGNLVLAAHNDIFGEIFRHLDDLVPGDEIFVYTASQRYIYVVRATQYVEPTDVQVMEPTRDPTVTLISCYPYQVNNERIVVFAEYQGVG